MKKTAVLIYDSFCNFEFSVALEILAMAEKEIVVFAKSKSIVKSEEGGAWFIGDETESLVSHDMFVNAWMSLPEPYRAEVEEN